MGRFFKGVFTLMLCIGQICFEQASFESDGIWLPTCQACVTINVKAQSVDVRHRVLHNILADPESSRVRQLLDLGRWAKRYVNRCSSEEGHRQDSEEQINPLKRLQKGMNLVGKADDSLAGGFLHIVLLQLCYSQYTTIYYIFIPTIHHISCHC